MPNFALPDRIGSFNRDRRYIATYSRGRVSLSFHPGVLAGFLGTLMFAIGQFLARLHSTSAYQLFTPLGDVLIGLVLLGGLVAMGGIAMAVAALFRLTIDGKEASFDIVALASAALLFAGLAASVPR